MFADNIPNSKYLKDIGVIDWNKLLRDLTLEEIDIDKQKLIQKLVNRDYTPGTFLISEREDKPRYLNVIERELGLTNWIFSTVEQDLEKITSILFDSRERKKFSIDELANNVYEILTYSNKDSSPIIQNIWNQEYSDIFRRIELFLLTGNPNFQLNLYKKVNDFADVVIKSIIDRFENEYHATLLDWCKLSVSAGLVGLNEKTAIDATSHFYRISEIPIFLNNSKIQNVNSIFDRLQHILKKYHAINGSEREVDHLVNIKNKFTIGIFTDDYIETIFLLKFYEELLSANRNIFAILIPKSQRCGNDATINDVRKLIKRYFPLLNRFIQEQRCILRPDGPSLGGLNILKLRRGLLTLINEMDLLDIRGCRAFEMTQGIKKPSLFSFNIIREISESITGIDGESSQMVFFHQDPGEHSFYGFKERFQKTKKAPSGREFMVVPYSVLEYYQSKYHKECIELKDHD